MVADLPLGGGSSRFDYLSLDPAGDRLYLAHLGADLVTVVDVRRRVILADIGGIPAPHGVLVVPALGRAYASATAAHELVTLDAASYRVLARTPAGQFPTGSPTTRPPASCCLRRVGQRGDRCRRGNWAAERRDRAWR